MMKVSIAGQPEAKGAETEGLSGGPVDAATSARSLTIE
jgi:hypothetical protein